MTLEGMFGSVHAQASARTGLSDFGDEDYHDGLKVLLASLDEDPYLSDIGRYAASRMVVDALVSRLQSEAGWHTDSRWQEGQIARPIFVLGLPRTGTTALHRLLAQDPEVQSLPYWLGMHPQPRPPREAWSGYPDFLQTSAWLEGIYERSPEMRVMHEMEADEPDECRLLRMQSFADFTFDTYYVPRYRNWLMSIDQGPTYARYRDNLRLIGVGDDRRWVLKCPGHLWALDALLVIFPDACVIQTHRSPEEVIPSGCSLRLSGSRFTEPELPLDVIGRDNLDRWLTIVERAHAVRGTADPARFHDVDFREFVANPVDEITKIYEKFGFAISDKAHSAMKHWHESRPRHRLGKHAYSAADFGLSEAGIRERFSDYCSRHGV